MAIHDRESRLDYYPRFTYTLPSPADPDRLYTLTTWRLSKLEAFDRFIGALCAALAPDDLIAAAFALAQRVSDEEYLYTWSSQSPGGVDLICGALIADFDVRWRPSVSLRSVGFCRC